MAALEREVVRWRAGRGSWAVSCRGLEETGVAGRDGCVSGDAAAAVAVLK